MAQAYVPIQTQTLTSTASSITFTNIPQIYKTLVIKYSARNNSSTLPFYISVNNNSGTQYSQFFHNDSNTLFAGRDTSSNTYSSYVYGAGTGQATDMFSNCELKFIDYSGSQLKRWYGTYTIANTSSSILMGRSSGYFTGVTTGITSISFSGTTFISGTTFTLYGVGGTRASGGTVTADADYTYHTFTSTGTFTSLERIKGAELLLIGGGGGGGSGLGGGGGAGGIALVTNQTLNAGASYTAVIGAGGGASGGTYGSVGSNSTFASFSGLGGGGGSSGSQGTFPTGNGGSGGGGGNGFSGGTATQPSVATVFGYGNNGGGDGAAAGGGGAGTAGLTNNTYGADGGAGTALFDRWARVTNTGVLSNGLYYYAGGGAGSQDRYNQGSLAGGTGGVGGGGDGADAGGSSSAGTANTGGGGGGGGNNSGVGSSGGSGLVIIRYPN